MNVILFKLLSGCYIQVSDLNYFLPFCASISCEVLGNALVIHHRLLLFGVLTSSRLGTCLLVLWFKLLNDMIWVDNESSALDHGFCHL